MFFGFSSRYQCRHFLRAYFGSMCVVGFGQILALRIKDDGCLRVSEGKKPDFNWVIASNLHDCDVRTLYRNRSKPD